MFFLNCSSWINKQLREKESNGSLPPIFFHPLCYLIVWMLSRSTAITCTSSRWKLRKGWTLQTSPNMCTHTILCAHIWSSYENVFCLTHFVYRTNIIELWEITLHVISSAVGAQRCRLDREVILLTWCEGNPAVGALHVSQEGVSMESFLPQRGLRETFAVISVGITSAVIFLCFQVLPFLSMHCIFAI